MPVREARANFAAAAAASGQLSRFLARRYCATWLREFRSPVNIIRDTGHDSWMCIRREKATSLISRMNDVVFLLRILIFLYFTYYISHKRSPLLFLDFVNTLFLIFLISALIIYWFAIKTRSGIFGSNLSMGRRHNYRRAMAANRRPLGAAACVYVSALHQAAECTRYFPTTAQNSVRLSKSQPCVGSNGPCYDSRARQRRWIRNWWNTDKLPHSWINQKSMKFDYSLTRVGY